MGHISPVLQTFKPNVQTAPKIEKRILQMCLTIFSKKVKIVVAQYSFMEILSEICKIVHNFIVLKLMPCVDAESPLFWKKTRRWKSNSNSSSQPTAATTPPPPWTRTPPPTTVVRTGSSSSWAPSPSQGRRRGCRRQRERRRRRRKRNGSLHLYPKRTRYIDRDFVLIN